MVTENSFLCNQRYLFNRPKCSSGRRASGFVLVGQAVDTTVVVLIIFYREPLSVILRLIVSGYLIKVLYETLMTPVTYLIVNFLKRTEGVDYFDYQTNFSPFATEE